VTRARSDAAAPPTELASSEQGPSDTDGLELIRRALASLKYGEIVIDVHDGKIVQIARTEKIRPRASRP